MALKARKGTHFAFEFLSIFIAVISAFALNNWNDYKRDRNAEIKTLVEISNGLEKDLIDIDENIFGHEQGLAATKYFRKLLQDSLTNTDSTLAYMHFLTRDYVSIQNSAGYESLKSSGLQLVQDDSLRNKIISLYEYHYTILQKMEEEYYEMQYHQNYFSTFNEQLAAHYQFNNVGILSGLSLPLEINEREKNKLMLYLWKIGFNRTFLLEYYKDVQVKIKDLQKAIRAEIN